MQIRLLGRPSVVRDGEPRVLPPRVGATLAILSTSPGLEMDNRKLSELLFPGVPPDKADWRTLVKRVRAEVGAAALPTARGSARLVVDTDQVDCLRFAALVHKAYGEQGGPRAQLLLDALALWSNDVPFEGIELSYLVEKRSELDRLRSRAHCALVEAELTNHQLDAALGHARSAPPDCWDSERFLVALATLLAEHGETRELKSLIPEYEQRTGGPAGRGLREHVSFLLSDDFSPRKLQQALASRRVPRELPAGLPELTGRESELGEIADNLSRPGSITVMCGPAGAGKTQLALRAGHEYQHKFEGGTLFADLRGFSADPPRDPRQRLLSWLAALDVSLREYGLDGPSAALDDLAAVYRSVLAERPVLVVLDNALDTDQVRPLLPSSGASACLITSRTGMRPLSLSVNVSMVEVRPWQVDTGIEFLDKGLPGGRVSADPFAARKLVEHCGGLPLALAAVRARLRRRMPEIDGRPGPQVVAMSGSSWAGGRTWFWALRRRNCSIFADG